MGNVLLPTRATGLPKDSVANVSQLFTVDHSQLLERVGILPDATLQLVLIGIEKMLDRG
jgi:mRNA interferase MazF